MPLGRTAKVMMLSLSIVTAALVVVFVQNNAKSEDFDYSVIRSAQADTTNALFLKVDGIPGSSQLQDHNGQIDLLWYCFGFSSRTDVPGCDTTQGKNVFDKTNFDGFHFIMADNKATPKLMTAYLNGTTIKTVTFYAQRGTTIGSSSDYLILTMNDVKVTSYFHGSNDKYKIPVVQVSMNFSKIQMEYKEGGQTVTGTWDFTTNRPF